MSPEELSRRITAARELRGISQLELGSLLAAEGLGKHDLAKIERRDDRAPPFTPLRRYALAKVLGVSERWFAEEQDASDLMELPTVDRNAVNIARLEESVQALDEKLDVLVSRHVGLSEADRDLLRRVEGLLSRLERDAGQGRPLRLSDQGSR